MIKNRDLERNEGLEDDQPRRMDPIVTFSGGKFSECQLSGEYFERASHIKSDADVMG